MLLLPPLRAPDLLLQFRSSLLCVGTNPVPGAAVLQAELYWERADGHQGVLQPPAEAGFFLYILDPSPRYQSWASQGSREPSLQLPQGTREAASSFHPSPAYPPRSQQVQTGGTFQLQHPANKSCSQSKELCSSPWGSSLQGSSWVPQPPKHSTHIVSCCRLQGPVGGLGGLGGRVALVLRLPFLLGTAGLAWQCHLPNAQGLSLVAPDEVLHELQLSLGEAAALGWVLVVQWELPHQLLPPLPGASRARHRLHLLGDQLHVLRGLGESSHSQLRQQGKAEPLLCCCTQRWGGRTSEALPSLA